MSTIPILAWVANGSEQSFPLGDQEFTVGRGHHADLPLNHPSVSRVHARFFLKDGKWNVVDLSSSYGTWVDGERTEAEVPTPIPFGSEIMLGRQTMVLKEASLETAESTASSSPFTFTGIMLDIESLKQKITSYCFEVENNHTDFARLKSRINLDLDNLANQLQEQLQDHQVLHKFTNLINHTLDVREILSTALRLASKVLSADYGLVLVYNAANERLEPIVSQRFDDEQATRIRVSDSRFSHTLAMTCFKSKSIQLVSDTGVEDGLINAASIVSADIRSVACIPLIRDEETLGVIYLDTRGRVDSFWKRHLEFLKIFAAQTANALHNARLYKEAITDDLTGLYLRKFMDRQFHAEMRRANRYDRPACALVLDLDHFKKVNDTYGHHTGDLVLQATAKLLQSQLRDTDFAGRMGGEEFAVLLPETEIEAATDLAQRIRDGVERMEVKADENIIKVTTSIGVVAYKKAFENDPVRLLDAADRALYRAKDEGRNRVIIG